MLYSNVMSCTTESLTIEIVDKPPLCFLVVELDNEK